MDWHTTNDIQTKSNEPLVWVCAVTKSGEEKEADGVVRSVQGSKYMMINRLSLILTEYVCALNVAHASPVKHTSARSLGR